MKALAHSVTRSPRSPRFSSGLHPALGALTHGDTAASISPSAISHSVHAPVVPLTATPILPDFLQGYRHRGLHGTVDSTARGVAMHLCPGQG